MFVTLRQVRLQQRTKEEKDNVTFLEMKKYLFETL